MRRAVLAVTLSTAALVAGVASQTLKRCRDGQACASAFYPPGGNSEGETCHGTAEMPAATSGRLMESSSVLCGHVVDAEGVHHWNRECGSGGAVLPDPLCY